MKPFKTQAHIHSLDGAMDKITVLEEIGDNKYLVDYRGVKCDVEDTLDFCQATLAAFEQKSPVSQTKFIFNWYNCTYYADDLYGKMEDKNNG